MNVTQWWKGLSSARALSLARSLPFIAIITVEPILEANQFRRTTDYFVGITTPEESSEMS